MADDYDRRRTNQVNFRLSDDELTLLTQLEALTGETRSILLRRLIRREHRAETRKGMAGTRRDTSGDTEHHSSHRDDIP